MKRTLSFSAPDRAPEVAGILLYGLGAIGLETARGLIAQRRRPLLAAVDRHADKVGRRLRDLLQDPAAPEVRVADVVPTAPPGRAVALHMSGSHLVEIAPQITDLMEAGWHVVSSAESLCYPALSAPEVARRLDTTARERGVALVGVGVNPGFVMDVLPVVTAGVCRDIERVEVVRIVDAATRREPLQRKIGSGLTPEEFERSAAEGRIGHVGLAESCAFVAGALDLDVEAIDEDLRPIIAEADIRTDFLAVKRGRVRGIHHTARARTGRTERVRLELVMALGEAEPRDEVRIRGRPPIALRIEGGVEGDSATVAAMLNGIPRAAAAPPGLHTLLDLPLRG